MRDMFPDGDDLRHAVKWISERLMENTDSSVKPLVQEAIFKFDLSPRDADFLIEFYSKRP